MDNSGNTYTAPIRLPIALRLLAGVEFRFKLGFCEKLFGRALARNRICWVRTAPGPIWKLDLANPTHRWIVYGCYEGPSLWRWLRSRAETLETVIDSGANIGQTTLYFATHLPDARIIAYEPGQSAREWLEEGVAMNKFTGVTVVAAGLSNLSGVAHLESEGGTELHGAWNKVHATVGEKINLVTIDGEIERLGIKRIDLWKLDVEGHELDALKGAERALADSRIGAIFIEMGEGKSECKEFLNRHGYVGWELGDYGKLNLWSDGSPWGNALFIKPEVK